MLYLPCGGHLGSEFAANQIFSLAHIGPAARESRATLAKPATSPGFLGKVGFAQTWFHSARIRPDKSASRYDSGERRAGPICCPNVVFQIASFYALKPATWAYNAFCFQAAKNSRSRLKYGAEALWRETISRSTEAQNSGQKDQDPEIGHWIFCGSAFLCWILDRALIRISMSAWDTASGELR